MKTARLTGLALAAAALGLASAPAFAAFGPSATATASISNVYIQVIDLDLSDGITAAVSFDSNGVYAQGYAYSVQNDSWAFLGSDSAQGDGSSDLSTSFWYGFGTATASTTAGDLFTKGSGPSATASASLSEAKLYMSGGGYLLQSDFTLTPMTLLVVTATPGSLSASAALGEYAYASAQINLQAKDDSQSALAQAYRYVQTDGQSYGTQPSFLQAAFANISTAEMSGYAHVSAQAQVQGIQVAVPEPGTYAMFFAGLMAVAGMVSRRTRR